ncbi:MAG: hypothetical protein ACFNQI_06685, partial [Eikenella corrodens]
RVNIRIAVKNCQRLWIIFYNRQRLPENDREILMFDNYGVLTFLVLHCWMICGMAKDRVDICCRLCMACNHSMANQKAT